MALNRVILLEKVGDKLTKAALSAIATETFMKALPLTKAEVAAESGKYAAFVTHVVNSLHGETMIKAAMEANAENAAAMKFLNKLNDTIKTPVSMACQRIANEAADNPVATLDEVVDQSGFTPEEMKTLVAKGKELDTSDIAEVIKNKVVTTIKNEKAAYDANAQMKQDIVDTLAETAGEDAPSTESWMDLHLSKSDPRQPITLFSRLQDVCMESLLQNETTTQLENDENVSLESLVDVTINQTLDCFDSNSMPLTNALEALTHACESLEFPEEEQKNRIACASKKSLIMAIVIMTIMETLKTMRLFCPDMDCIRKFVDTPTSLEKGTVAMGANVSNRITQQVAKAKGILRDPAYNSAELSQAFDALSNLRSAVENVSETAMPNKAEVKKALEDVCTMIEGKLATESTGSSPLISQEANLARERNIASMNKMYRILNRNPNTAKIRVCCESSANKSAENAVIMALALDSTGAEVSRMSLGIEMVPAFGSVMSEIHAAAGFSSCTESANMCELYFTDKCYAVPLIDE